jgi:hypothetical protein
MASTTDQLMMQDETAMGLSLNDLGWVDRDPAAPEVEKLRKYLAANNGIRDLEVVTPDEVERATDIFYRDGFVVVRDVLGGEQLEFLRAGCDRVIHEMMSFDRHRVGNRGSHRYSFGSASKTGHLMHNAEWAMLLDLPTVTPILTAIFGSADYISRGGGGDFCLPGAVEYQQLHSDMGDRQDFTRKDGTAVSFGSFKDPRGILTYRDLPCPYVCCNFLMVDFTPTNGATRQIPGTQHSRHAIPTLHQEPEWMKLSAVCPAPAGSVMIRDVRAWHGGTPNLSREVRAIPNAEFYAPWFREPMGRCVPRDIYNGLSDHGKRVCRYIVADEGRPLDVGVKENLGSPPRRSKKED